MSIWLLLVPVALYLAWPRGLVALLRSLPDSNDDFHIGG
jgi:hypothetical protein